MNNTLGLYIGSPDSPNKAPDWLLAPLQSVRVEQGDGDDSGNFQQGVQIVLRANRSRGSQPDYRLLQEKVLEPGQRVVVTVSLNARQHVLFDGILAHRQLAPNGAGVEPSLTVMGKDISVLMDLEVKDVDHAGLGDREIAQTILGKYSRYGVTAQVSTPAKTWTANEKERIPKQVATDREYLQMLARRHSYIFCIKPGPTPAHSTGYWGPLDYSSSPQKALTVNAGPSTNVETFQVSDDALAPTQVFGNVRDANAAQATALNVQKSSLTTALSKESRLTDNASFVRKLRLVYSGASTAEGQALAQAIADRSTESTVRVTGTLDAFTYGEVLMAPGKVDVRGAGFSYDGTYYVRHVSHLISSEEYKQEFVLTRAGPGSTTRKVKP